MVTSPARWGFSLVEVMVALVLLTVGILGTTALATLATRTLADAQAEERAVLFAAVLLDSLLQEPFPASGEALEGHLAARWSLASAPVGRTIDLTVEFGTASRRGAVRFHMRHALLPPPVEP